METGGFEWYCGSEKVDEFYFLCYSALGKKKLLKPIRERFWDN